MTGPSSAAAHPKPKSAPTESARTLENDLLRVVIDPSRGGKCLSLYSRRTGTEWLLPPLRPYADAKNTGGFDEWDGGGFDECLPTVAATATAPDHGELWHQTWQDVPDATGNAIALRTTACGGALLFERRAHLEGASLVGMTASPGLSACCFPDSIVSRAKCELATACCVPPEVGL